MTIDEQGLDSIKEEADRKGKARKDLDRRNARRRAKGKKPLPDEQELKDMQVTKIRHKTGDFTTVDGAEALRLFEMRKQAMMAKDDDMDDDMDDDTGVRTPARESQAMAAAMSSMSSRRAAPAEGRVADGRGAGGFSPRETIVEEEARKKAEAVRRASDMKNGRINHESAWSPEGQRLEKGDETVIAGDPSASRFADSDGSDGSKVASSVSDAWGDPRPRTQADPPEDKSDKPSKLSKPSKPSKSSKTSTASRAAKSCKSEGAMGLDEFREFKEDLYYRLKVSFAGIEQSLSEVIGRVSELSAAQAPHMSGLPVQQEQGEDDFRSLLSRKTPVTFDVGGTKMTFDAITVFHASPCITVVSRSGSATIMPKPGARLDLTYEMDGVRYENDPVTFLGTRFELPMFGLSFVGFIRDQEAAVMDVEAGVSEGR